MEGSFGTPALTSLPVINGSNAIAPAFTDQLAFNTVSRFRSEEVYWGLEFLLQSDYSLLEDGSLVVSPFTGITFTDRRNDYFFDNHTVITNFHNMNLTENVDTDYVGWKFGARVTYDEPSCQLYV